MYAASVGTTPRSDLEWPLHASRAISAIAELLFFKEEPVNVRVKMTIDEGRALRGSPTEDQVL